MLDGIAGTYEARAYLSPWNGDRSLPALATTTFTDGNVKTDGAPSGVEFVMVESVYTASTNCTGTIKNTFPKTDSDGDDTIGVGNNESLRLDAAANANAPNATRVFKEWTTTSGAASFSVIAGTGGKSICIVGFQAGTQNFFANYDRPPVIASD